MDGRTLARSLFLDCWSGGRLELLEELLAADHRFHPSEGDLVGVEDYRALLACYRRAFSPTFEIRHLIAEGDLVAVHYEEAGVFAADWTLGDAHIAATGLPYETFGVELLRIEGDRIAEAWPGHDSLTHWTRIGVARFGEGGVQGT